MVISVFSSVLAVQYLMIVILAFFLIPLLSLLVLVDIYISCLPLLRFTLVPAPVLCPFRLSLLNLALYASSMVVCESFLNAYK